MYKTEHAVQKETHSKKYFSSIQFATTERILKQNHITDFSFPYTQIQLLYTVQLKKPYAVQLKKKKIKSTL